VGAILMTLLTIVVLAVAVVDSRDRVRRDVLVSDATLREWYDAHYGRRGLALNRENLQAAIRRVQTVRLWGPVALSAGTMLAALILTFTAATRVPGIERVWSSPSRVVELVSTEALVGVSIVFMLLPVLVVEGVLAVLYVADFDIGRLRRLLNSIS